MEGLYVMGSYVPKTTAQLKSLLKNNAAAMKIAVNDLLAEASRDHAIHRAVDALNQHIRQGEDAVVFTSRKLVVDASDQDNLAIGKRVSESLIRIVRGLNCQPRFLVV